MTSPEEWAAMAMENAVSLKGMRRAIAEVVRRAVKALAEERAAYVERALR